MGKHATRLILVYKNLKSSLKRIRGRTLKHNISNGTQMFPKKNAMISHHDRNQCSINTTIGNILGDQFPYD